MTPSQLNNVKKQIGSYLASDNSDPYFVSVDGGSEYSSIVVEYSGYRHMRISEYCEQDDSFPNVDKLFADVQSLDCNSLLLGIGESMSLGCRGSNALLGKLKDLALPYKLVVLCRGIRDDIRKINESDRKFNRRRFAIVDSTIDYCVIRLDESIPLTAAKGTIPIEEGFRRLLSHLEDGKPGEVMTKSSLPLANVNEIHSCYMLLSKEGKITQVDEAVLPEEYWRSYLEDDNLEGYGLSDWRTYLKMLMRGTSSPYLQLVKSKSDNYNAYKRMLIQALLFIDAEDARFASLYDDRKKLLEKEINEATASVYVAEAKRHGDKRLLYLTDATRVERRAIVEDIATYGWVPDNIGAIYPALASYLFDYAFKCSNGELFTRYFTEYKRAKLFNTVDSGFLKRVVELAQDGNRAYNALESRNAVVEQTYGPDVFLYWVDALGVEYLGYIQERAKQLGLSMNTHVARASLPTLTYLNKDFYDAWRGDKCALKEFDELKHGGEEGPESKIGELPTHIVRELEIIDSVLEYAQQGLASHSYQRFVIASDHGSSRLAVIYDSENKWEMQTKGEHSGRCCPTNEINERPTCATEENGYWVLANYDRFKGGRRASVEVHGGASLEEVLVPIIELSLRDASIRIECLTKVAYSSYQERPTIELFSISSLVNLTVRLNDRIYPAVAAEQNRFEVRFDDLTRIGTYTGDVYEGDDPIGSVTFKVQKRTAKTNDDDWFD